MRFLPYATIVFFLIFGITASVEAKRITSFEKRPDCEKSGGVWRQFGDACADGCMVKFNQFSMCAQALTYSCDCLENRCFDGTRCVEMSDYKVKYDEIKKNEQELLNNLKEARQGEYEANRQRIMQKLFGTGQNNTGQNSEQNSAQNLDAIKNQQNTPANNNLVQGKTSVARPIKKPSTGNDFEVPPFFANQQNDAQKSLDQKNKEDNDKDNSTKSLELPDIPLPKL